MITCDIRMTIRPRFVSIIFLLCGALALAGSAHASTIAYSFLSAPTSVDDPLSFGFEFTATQALEVLALGYYDAGNDGFLTPHEVGIYDSEGTLLASTLLGTGAGATLLDGFRYQDITPLQLVAGDTYTIAATSGGRLDYWAYGQAGTSLSGFSTDPGIQVASNAGVFAYQNDDVLRDPTQHYIYTLYAGPNFLIGPIPSTGVPEPGTGALLGLAILGFWMVRRRFGKLAPAFLRRR